MAQLGILYAKYKEQKLMEHINLFWSKLSIPSLLNECRKNYNWKEVVFLYTHYDQFDNAIDVMIEHHSCCWEHENFKSIIARVSNPEVYYRAINFYIKNQPFKLNELLIDLIPQLDHKRVTKLIQSTGHLPLIKQYLEYIQKDDIHIVNEALNLLYIEEEKFNELRRSVEHFKQFDHNKLAKKLERHDLIEFRRIASYLYKLNEQWSLSIELSKKDHLWKDAMNTGSECGDNKIVEDLLNYFASNEKIPKSVFGACL